LCAHTFDSLHIEQYPFCVLGGSNFILHCCMYSTLNISLLFGAGFSYTKKNMEYVSLGLYCLMFQIFVTVCPSFQ
jgi:hypothetical protein